MRLDVSFLGANNSVPTQGLAGAYPVKSCLETGKFASYHSAAASTECRMNVSHLQHYTG